MNKCTSGATRRYIIRVASLMALYLILLVATKWIFQTFKPDGPAAWALAVLPALPLIGVFWAVMRLLVEETDEYIRMLIVRQCLFATGFCLTIMTIWQWLQNFDILPPGNGGFGAAFFWFIGLGFGGLYNRITMGDWGNPW
ncbi:hypothetical protein [Qipengyuania sp. DGS5-3]|uniref:hypothetical protein n=1 Tax=Qipengyuania sp. DGS5-3 TaxID=3349632 RepID=UPI0036D37AE8